MELEELKQSWQTLTRQLEKQQALAWQSFKDGRLDRARRRLRPLRWGQRVQIAAGLGLMALSAPFWVERLDTPHLAVCGLMLHAYGLMLVLTAARNLYLQGALDPSLPVVELQKRLATLRVWRLKEGLLYGVTGCLIWIPLLLVVFALLGADLWVNAPAVVWSDVAAGVGCLALLYGILAWSQRPGNERWRAALLASSIGRSVLDTQAMLEEIARFEA